MGLAKMKSPPFVKYKKEKIKILSGSRFLQVGEWYFMHRERTGGGGHRRPTLWFSYGRIHVFPFRIFLFSFFPTQYIPFFFLTLIFLTLSFFFRQQQYPAVNPTAATFKHKYSPNHSHFSWTKEQCAKRASRPAQQQHKNTRPHNSPGPASAKNSSVSCVSPPPSSSPRPPHLTPL